MTDKQLLELYFYYGRILYGQAYISLCSQNIKPTYENLLNEINLIIQSSEKVKQF